MASSDSSKQSLRRAAITMIGGVALAATIGGAAVAAECFGARERASLDVRVLQSKLMVAALMCNQRNEYNDFVVRFRPALRAHGRTLINYFDQTFDAAGKRQLDRFVTALANEASRESNIDRAGFCRDARLTLKSLVRQTATRLDARAFNGFVSGSRATAELCTLTAAR